MTKKQRKSRRCDCGELSPFELLAGKPDNYKSSKYYCHKHFIHELHKCFFKYDGHFIIVSANLKDNENDVQYIFYAPEDLSLDDYSETDIESIKDIISMAFKNNNHMAVKIPADAVKEDVFDDGPLFTKSVNCIEMQPIDKESFLSYLERETIKYDNKKKTFRMNKPYSKAGVYIWNN